MAKRLSHTCSHCSVFRQSVTRILVIVVVVVPKTMQEGWATLQICIFMFQVIHVRAFSVAVAVWVWDGKAAVLTVCDKVQRTYEGV